ncbi:MAG: cellulase family glycosylhydrolase [Oscillospiraceae bacterium]|jgi:endoglycosylceramidase|nr:cellulase family glycosylhydrolase [Oscillospiraceae bacterium]
MQDKNMSYISHAGTWLTDEAGRVVQVHGLRVNYIKDPPYMEEISDEDLAFLASEGLNAMRVNWTWGHAEPEPGVYNDEYLDSIVTLNDRLAKFGIRSLIGMVGSFGGFHAPAWAHVNRYFGRNRTLMEYFAEEREPQTGGLDGTTKRSEREMEAWDNFYADALAPDDVGVMTHCANTWKRLASRLESKSNVFALDLFHEPAPGYEFEVLHDEVRFFTEPVLFEIKKLWRFHRKFIREVREADKRHILFYAGSCYHTSEQYANFKVNMPANFSDDENIGYSTHISCHDAGKLTPEKFRSNINKALDNQWGHAAESDIAFVVSGFRHTLEPSVYANFIDTLAARNIPWTYFTFRGVQAGPTDSKLSLLKDPAKTAAPDNVKDDFWDAFVVPYAQLTAGTPVSCNFNRDTKVLEYKYSTAPAGKTPIAPGAATEIFIPVRHYPTGYSVEVSGAAVKSHETSAWVVLENDENAKEVCVTVRPKDNSFTERASWGFGPTSAVR